jgi:hypothetical protein
MDSLRTPATIVLAVLLAAAVVLIGVELASSAGDHDAALVQRPCAPRPLYQGAGFDATVQRVVLDGLGITACRLGTSREQLVLTLAPGAKGRSAERDRAAEAFRAGLLRALDRGRDRGDVPALFAPVLRRLVEHAPIEDLLQGRFSLGSIFDG